MATYQELLEQRNELEKEIQKARAAEVHAAVVKVKSLVETFGLTPEDVFSAKGASTSARKVEPKYRDPETGQTWTGRGKPPKWIQDKDREAFAI